MALLPSEQFEVSHLRESLIAVQKSDNRSAAKLLLGNLTEAGIESAIMTQPQAKALQSLANTVLDFDASGNIVSKTLARSAYEMWKAVRVGTKASRSPKSLNR